jgi:putative ABC transport system permease protein
LPSSSSAAVYTRSAAPNPDVRLTELILRELLHRKVNFILALLAVTIAVVAWAAALGSLHRFDATTHLELDALQETTDAEMDRLEDEIRKTMKGLGFNVYMFPAGEELWQIKQRGYSEDSMPQDYVQRLADSDVVSVNHLLPQLSRRVDWSEQKRSVLLVGVSGQVPIAHRNMSEPMMDPLEPGTAFLGHDLHRSLNVQVGDAITLNGRSYRVAKTFPPRNFLDDGTVWIHLDEAQELFGMRNRINAILALGCNCTSIDRLGDIRRELGAILPDVQFVEIGSSAMVRAEARNETAAQAEKAKQAVLDRRNATRRERARFAKLLAPLLAIAAFIGVATLSFSNVRERLPEIGTLRALGVANSRILALLLGRALLTGLLSWPLAYGLSAALAGADWNAPLPVSLWLTTLLALPVLSLAAAWLPALDALRRDPVAILRHD